MRFVSIASRRTHPDRLEHGERDGPWKENQDGAWSRAKMTA